MAKSKKGDVAFQEDLETNDQFEDFLDKKGLSVVEVYQSWCGTCKSIVQYLRKIKSECSGDDEILRFATAKANTIDPLSGFIGHSIPEFLIFGSGELVARLKGVDYPKLSKLIFAELAKEKVALQGNGSREAISIPEYSPSAKRLESGRRAKTPAPQPLTKDPDVVPDRPFTIALIKPDVVQSGRVDEVIYNIKEAGIDIIEHIERRLSQDEAASFYYHKRNEPYYKQLIKYMTSGPSHILVLAKDDEEDLLGHFREILGPSNAEQAKEEAPDSLRAKFGTKDLMNGIHGSDTQGAAMKELAFFFPDFKMPSKPQPSHAPANVKEERTLAIIRPDALKEHKEAILKNIKEAGFSIALHKEINLSYEQAKEFYKEHEGKPFFDDLIANMTSGPVLVLALVRVHAVNSWRSVLGPKEVPVSKAEAPESMRAKYAVNDKINPMHGSDSPESAEREVEFFFPKQQTVAVIKPEAVAQKSEIFRKIEEAGFHITAAKETELTNEMVALFYKDLEGKPFYEDLSSHLANGHAVVMVLDKNDAVDQWRQALGPTDPEEARAVAPGSLRAVFGEDILKNALHGVSTYEKAQSTIKALFEEDLDENGKVRDKGVRVSKRTKDDTDPVKDQDLGENGSVQSTTQEGSVKHGKTDSLKSVTRDGSKNIDKESAGGSLKSMRKDSTGLEKDGSIQSVKEGSIKDDGKEGSFKSMKSAKSANSTEKESAKEEGKDGSVKSLKGEKSTKSMRKDSNNEVSKESVKSMQREKSGKSVTKETIKEEEEGSVKSMGSMKSAGSAHEGLKEGSVKSLRKDGSALSIELGGSIAADEEHDDAQDFSDETTGKEGGQASYHSVVQAPSQKSILEQNSVKSIGKEISTENLRETSSNNALGREASAKSLGKQPSSKSLGPIESNKNMVEDIPAKMSKQASVKSIGTQGSSQSVAKQTSVKDVAKGASATSMAKEASVKGLEMEDSANIVAEESSAKSLGNEASAQSIAKQSSAQSISKPSAASVGKASSGQNPDKEASVKSIGKEPSALTKELDTVPKEASVKSIEKQSSASSDPSAKELEAVEKTEEQGSVSEDQAPGSEDDPEQTNNSSNKLTRRGGNRDTQSTNTPEDDEFMPAVISRVSSNSSVGERCISSPVEWTNHGYRLVFGFGGSENDGNAARVNEDGTPVKAEDQAICSTKHSLTVEQPADPNPKGDGHDSAIRMPALKTGSVHGDTAHDNGTKTRVNLRRLGSKQVQRPEVRPVVAKNERSKSGDRINPGKQDQKKPRSRTREEYGRRL